MIAIGDRLPNGAKVIGVVRMKEGVNPRGYVVMAVWRDDEIVCWCADADGNCFWGRYCNEAWPAFRARTERYCE